MAKAEDILNLYTQLKAHYVDTLERSVWLQFTGGEPTMHQRIIDLLKEASQRGFSVSLISNASRTIRFWIKIRDYLDSVILTYHNEFSELSHFVGVAKILADHMNVHINVTMHPDRFDRTFSEAETLRIALPNATITLKPLRLGFGSELYEYTLGQRRILSDGIPVKARSSGPTPRSPMVATTQSGDFVTMRANDFILRDINHWQGYMWNIGLESLRVKGSGDILRAVCGVGGKIGQLGHIVSLPSSAIYGTKETCSCVADILTTKIKMLV